ncbi:uncharacterized protein LOC121805101 isoform X1 [Salvia splendens]|uniref:uncharacterized protein LOC121805101 isoform X1 n=1 Tax=Salvia splendens TaxID=180675 RepID=UPI001C278DFF|nr:uncharacterized protein LOC121805101 isoform X1 [Salvia splendens]
MQGLHHQQQQLAALLTAALPKDDSTTTTPTSSSPPSEEDESSRLAAITSLHRALLYPPNSLLVTHSASFLAQGFSQLLTDKLYSVRHAAAAAYGALCSVLSSFLLSSNGRQNNVLLCSLIDRFIGWSLPSLSNTSNGTSELALVSLHEFLNVGEGGAVERYALPILKACQELLEDERTSMSVLPRILGVLTLISLKFIRVFQPHFMDIVDLLLGWAMVPDVVESDKRVIMDSFLQFQKHWVNNMQFSLGLLSKFLGDMDLLLQDGCPGSPQQFKRLLSLLSCFCTVLKSLASGLLEINFLEQIGEPLSQMVPLLLRCLSMIGRKFGWSKWVEDSWRCLTLLAEILGERFSMFYSLAVDVLFQSLELENANPVHTKKISSFQVHGVLKTNLQLLSLQKLGLTPLSVQKILHFDKSIFQFRLHPNHLVTGSAAATYIFLLQHRKNDVVEKTIDSIFEELQSLKSRLELNSCKGGEHEWTVDSRSYSKSELVVLIKFDLQVLLSCVSVGGDDSFIRQAEAVAWFVGRAEKLASFLINKFDPFSFPIQSSVLLQVTLLRTLERLAAIEFMGKCFTRKENTLMSSHDTSSLTHVEEENIRVPYPARVLGHVRRYSKLLIRALDSSSPLAVKVEALKWMQNFCENVIDIYRNAKAPSYPCQVVSSWKITEALLLSTLAAASDREPEVRYLVATVLEMLMRAKVIHPMHFPILAEVILEKLADPEKELKDAYLKLLSHVLPTTVYVCGLCGCGAANTSQPQLTLLTNRSFLHWKQVFALKQLPQQFHSQQLVSILSYISQRWKVPLSSWIQRLIHTSRSKKNHQYIQAEEVENIDASGLWWDIKFEKDILEKICSVNHLAGAWWAVHEAARFCITTRLRTNLGGPTQTFAALERMLLDISHLLQMETSQNDGALNIIGSYAHLLPMRLLLEFVEALKKNVYNAYEGSMVLPSTSQTSSLFFRANKKVCEEWFSRISEPMMDAGVAIQCHDATTHYCMLRLHDISNIVASALTDKSRVQVTENLQTIRGRYAGDIFRIIRNLALALCKMYEPEALIGLQKWAAMVFSPLFANETLGSIENTDWRHFSWITGLVYQARGQHEKAAAHFISLLQTEESITSLGSDGVQYAIARIIESYTAISDWKSLDSWLLELQNIRAKYAGKSYSGALTTTGNELNSIQALARFDEGDFQAAWSYLDLTPKSSNELTLDPKLALQRSEQMLLQAMLHHNERKEEKVPSELQKAKSMLEESVSVLPLDGLVEAAPLVNQLYCISAFEEGCKLGDSQGKHFPSLLSSYIETMQFPCNQVHQDCSLWLNVLRVCQNTLSNSLVTLEFCKNLVILARKQKNLMLATRLISYLDGQFLSYSNEITHDYFISSLEYENILLMRVEDKVEDAYKSVWSIVCPSMLSSTAACISQDNVLKAKACLKLSNWLLEDRINKNLEDIVYKMQADFSKSELSSPSKGTLASFDGNQGSKSRLNLIIDELVGTARKSSTLLCPMMGKSWILYASWCYTQAKTSVYSNGDAALRSCSFSPILAPEIQPHRFSLTDEEKSCVKEVTLQLIPVTSYQELHEESADGKVSVAESTDYENERTSLLQQIIDVIENAAGVPGAENCSRDDLSAALSSQLKKCFLTFKVAAGMDKLVPLVTDLVNVWWSLRRRRVSLFGQAAQAFINYLSCSSFKSSDCQSTWHDVEMKYKHVSYTLRATLYVLDILVNYGVELQDNLEPALSKVPLLPWQEIAPQLFAQLSSHPDKVVRKQLESLLAMLAKHSPWSLVYPTLVDANSPEKGLSEELQRILAYLKKLYPNLVHDAQLIIKELENVTVLWEELWLGTLQDLHPDVMRRISLLKEEAARIAESTTLTHGQKNKINAAKYSAMMAPIVVVLERRLMSTAREPQTPHEVWFVKEYQVQIRSALAKFKTPPASIAALGEVWRPFEAVATSLASYQRKSSISFGEVAPQLALLSSTNAPMPGLEKQIVLSESEGLLDSFHQEIIMIASFSEQLTILPTKTKPKKLIIMGSDGLKYTYLLKGREDLRLDARIMQLLQSVNGFLQSSSATRRQSLSVHYYSVTPISGRAGLIQWVDNVVSIYSVFKSWQERAQLQQLSAPGAGTNAAAPPPPVPRPSDMFYGKIMPALKEKGIRRVISRRDWPHDVKRKVLIDLMNETPKKLLHQELWCSSEGFKAFSSKLKRFSGSVAAMSIVGHILGLGDRHLDNILIDFSTGDILHIDYNVCFDKGQRLKIPEIVPFRLTQTIEAALGLTGIEGSFRANCEAILGVLRKNKDIILMLLDVFVWDPLVEWTRANFHDDAAVVGEERKGMELAVSLSLFASRVQEIHVPLQEHHDLLVSTLPAIESAIERFASILNHYEMVSSDFYQSDQERSELIQYESSGKSLVAEATSNSEKNRALFELQVQQLSQEQTMVMEIGQEAGTWIEQHGRILDALRSSSIPEINAGIKLTGSNEVLSLAAAVTVAGVPLTVVPEPTQIQCHDTDREVSNLVAELDDGLSSAVATLQMYSLVLQRILPLNYLTSSPVHGWAQVLLSLNNLSSDITSFARRQGAELVNDRLTDRFDSTKSNYEELCVRAARYAADIERLEEECAGLVNSIGPETESKAKERLLSSLINYMQHTGLKRKEESSFSEPSIHKGTSNISFHWDNDEKKESCLNVLDAAIISLFSNVKHRMQHSLDNYERDSSTNRSSQSDLGSFFCKLEEQVENCVLVTEFINELKYLVGLDILGTEADPDSLKGSWISVFKTSILLCKNLLGNTIEAVVPSVIQSAISLKRDVMDIFGSVSQIRGSVDTALDQLIQVELERVSLIELESNYFVKVGLITEKQLALEEAAVKGRDHLSWEEAEELASQEEACRVQLDKLHQTWNHKDLRTSSLMKKEANVNGAVLDSKLRLQSLLTAEPGNEPHVLRMKALLAAILEPFSELESVDQELMSSIGPVPHSSNRIPYLLDSINSGCSVSEYIWKLPGSLQGHAFFIWKVYMVDLLLDSCMQAMAASFDENLGFDQLVDVVKKKLRIQFQEHITKYLKDRVAPIFLKILDRQIEIMRQRSESVKDMEKDTIQMDYDAARSVQLILEEYCNAHETLKAATSAASSMKRQAEELKDALLKTSLEVSQMEWMHNINSRPSEITRLISHKIFTGDNLLSVILNTNRARLLESMRSSVSTIARSLESLQCCEGTSVTAEGQLERAMSWACGGPNPGSAGNVLARNAGIPPEFHDHLLKRRKFLQEASKNASYIMQVCISILEFEASRDGMYRTISESSSLRTGADGGNWQQSCLSAVTKLDVAYHSFTRAEKEWMLAQSNMEAASSDLISVTNELSIASQKSKSASGDLQNTLIAMRDSACEAGVALSSYVAIVGGHSALISECGSMLEEVLAITEGLQDVHILGKEAAALHSSLMNDLSKANAVLIPLESLLSKDVSAMTDAIALEKENKLEIAPIHGQAIFQSYHNRLKEALQVIKPLVPPLTSSVKGLYSVLTRLARAAGLHAGNLHKALEGVGESLQVRSQDINPLGEDAAHPGSEYDTEETDMFVRSDGDNDEASAGMNELALPDSEWISAPVSIKSGHAESGATSAEAGLVDSFSHLDVTEPISGAAEVLESLDGKTDSNNNQQERSSVKYEHSILDENKEVDEELQKTSSNHIETVDRPHMGKNAYAMSVLRRVEMKIDGQDISDNREISIPEQVDFLLRQATNIDNLCNMYEGWTPWI